MTSSKSMNPVYVVAADVCVLLIFAAIGRQTHAETNQALAILSTGLPFIISWLTVSALTGLERPQPFKRWIMQTLAWAPLSALIGLALRSIWMVRTIPWTFAIITLCVTTFLLIVVRVLFSLRSFRG